MHMKTFFPNRAIINHFSPKVDSWAAANQLSSLTEEQVMFGDICTLMLHIVSMWSTIC